MSKLRVVQARHVVLPALAALIAVALAVAGAGSTREATAALPPGNTVAQWNKIAEDTVVGSGAFQNEGLIYMSYDRPPSTTPSSRSRAGTSRYGPTLAAARRALASTPPSSRPPTGRCRTTSRRRAPPSTVYADALAAISERPAKTTGSVGHAAANRSSARATGDGRTTPIGRRRRSRLPPGPGVWRLTPPLPATADAVGRQRPPVRPRRAPTSSCRRLRRR